MGIVTPEVIQRVAHLARIRVAKESLAELAGQLDTILGYVRKLQSVPTDDVEPTSHVLPLTNVLRPDESRPSLRAEIVAGLAPVRHEQFISVPKVIES